MNPCGWVLSTGETCGRPDGHTTWSLDVGWPHETVSAYAHSAAPQPYDAEAAPYLADCSERAR